MFTQQQLFEECARRASKSIEEAKDIAKRMSEAELETKAIATTLDGIYYDMAMVESEFYTALLEHLKD
jgi:hypothetical protein